MSAVTLTTSPGESGRRPAPGIVDLSFFHIGKVTIGALQLLAPLTTLVVVGPPCQFGTLFSLSSEEFRRSHFETPPNSRLSHCSIFDFAMQ